ncbi:hypothetical protein V6K52_10090 [Knoellia sp. S7-12]|uniref:hypothetical protein n=1 Tax=Knoellia sp. S7-12 TaxID=3126698 RepID=UPI003368E48F
MSPIPPPSDGPEAPEDAVETPPEEESPEIRAIYNDLTEAAKTRLLSHAEANDVRRIRAARERTHREATASRRRARHDAHDRRLVNDPTYALRTAPLPEGATRSPSGVVNHRGHTIVPTTVGIGARPAFLIIAPDQSRRAVYDPAEALEAVDNAAPLTSPVRRPSRGYRSLRSLRL